MIFPPQSTIVLLYAGELGATLGQLLAAQGHRVIAPVSGRGPRTRQRAISAGFEAAKSLAEALRQADVVLSVVPPGAATAVLTEVLSGLCGCQRAPLFVDANSISPATARDLQDRCSKAGLPMVDMAVQGQAAGLPERGNLFFSGPNADAVAHLFGPTVSTRILGTEVGAASRFKMLLSALYKSMTALYLEASANAHAAGVLPAYLETTRAFYPGMVTAVERMLPSYPRHAARRADELREAEAMLADMGIAPGMVHEARRLLERLAASPVCRNPDAVPTEDPLTLLTSLVVPLSERKAKESA